MIDELPFALLLEVLKLLDARGLTSVAQTALFGRDAMANERELLWQRLAPAAVHAPGVSAWMRCRLELLNARGFERSFNAMLPLQLNAYYALSITFDADKRCVQASFQDDSVDAMQPVILSPKTHSEVQVLVHRRSDSKVALLCAFKLVRRMQGDNDLSWNYKLRQTRAAPWMLGPWRPRGYNQDMGPGIQFGSQSTAVLSRPFRVDDDIGRYEAGECNDEDDTWEEFWLHLNWQTDSECWGNMTSADFGELLEHRIEWL